MAKRKPEEEVNEYIFEPTQEEVLTLQRELKKFEQKRINGKLQPRIDQYAQAQGILYFNEFGDTIMRKPQQFAELMEVYKRMRAMEFRDQESYFAAFPEKREEQKDQFRALSASLKSKWQLK